MQSCANVGNGETGYRPFGHERMIGTKIKFDHLINSPAGCLECVLTLFSLLSKSFNGQHRGRNYVSTTSELAAPLFPMFGCEIATTKRRTEKRITGKKYVDNLLSMTPAIV